MIAPLALYTAAMMATSCSRSLLVAGSGRLLIKRQRQQHQPRQLAVVILNRTISMLIAPHNHTRHRQRQPLLLRHHRPAISSLPSAPLRLAVRAGGSEAAHVAPSAAAGDAMAFAGGGANPLRRRGRGRQKLFFSTSSSSPRRTKEIVENQSPGDGGKKQQKTSSRSDDLPQQQQQQQPTGNTPGGLSPSHVRNSSMAVMGGSSSLAVLFSTRGKNGDSDGLERCRRLAQNLGVALLVDGGVDWWRRERGVERGEGGAGAETDGFRFTMSFDETGRLALGQLGSGFKPLAVDFSGGKTGHRVKNQKGTEQIVKAAALPKRRTGAAASAATAAPAAATGGGDGGGGGATAAAAAVNGHQMSSGLSWGLNGEGGGGGGLEEGCGDVEEEPQLLWDLTAGLGTDSFVLALAGWRVEMFERSAVVAALVQDALDRARAGDDETARTAASRMSLIVADSIHACAERAAGQGWGGGGTAARRPAVVYLDPMFPRRKKSALVKKGMQMLQALLEEDRMGRATRQGRGDAGADGGGGGSCGVGGVDGSGVGVGGGGGGGGGDGGDGGETGLEERRLFDAAMSVATRKVVVKRPVHGAAIVEHVAPSHAVVSKNGRFDVYLVK